MRDFAIILALVAMLLVVMSCAVKVHDTNLRYILSHPYSCDQMSRDVHTCPED